MRDNDYDKLREVLDDLEIERYWGDYYVDDEYDYLHREDYEYDKYRDSIDNDDFD